MVFLGVARVVGEAAGEAVDLEPEFVLDVHLRTLTVLTGYHPHIGSLVSRANVDVSHIFD